MSDNKNQNKSVPALSERIYPYKQPTDFLLKGLLLSGKAG